MDDLNSSENDSKQLLHIANNRKEWFSQLPYELKSLVFSYLDTSSIGCCSQVCKAWQKWTQDLCNHLDFSPCALKLSDKLVSVVLNSHPQIRSLDLSNCLYLSPQLFGRIARMKSLQHLRLSHCPIADCIDMICTLCTELTLLDVSHTSVTDATISIISSHLHLLQTLNVSYCFALTWNCLFSLKSIKTLKSLNMRGCTIYQNHYYANNSNNGAASQVDGLEALISRLHTLDVKDCRWFLDTEHLLANAHSMETLVWDYGFLKPQSLPTNSLSTLVLSNCLLSEDYLRMTVEGCLHLKKLCLIAFKLLNQDDVSNIFRSESLQNLKLIDCGGEFLTGSHLKSITQSCSNLTSITILLCPKIQEEDICTLTAGCSKLKKLKLASCDIRNPFVQSSVLETLILKESSIVAPKIICPVLKRLEIHDSTHFDDSSLEVIQASSPLLKKLTLSRCRGLKNPIIRSSELEILEMAACSDMEDPVISCKSLKQLNLSACIGLINPTINCPKLRSLDLSASYKLQSPFINCENLIFLAIGTCKQFVKPKVFCPTLRILDLSRCLGSSSTLLTQILECCTSLYKLDLDGYNDVSDEMIALVKKKFPSLIVKQQPKMQFTKEEKPVLKPKPLTEETYATNAPSFITPELRAKPQEKSFKERIQGVFSKFTTKI